MTTRSSGMEIPSLKQAGGREEEKNRASVTGSSPREEASHERRLEEEKKTDSNLFLSAEAAKVLTETIGDTIRLRPPDPLKYIADALWKRSGYTPEEYRRELEESRRLSQENQRKMIGKEAEKEVVQQ